MGRLADTSVAELQHVLERVEEKKPTLRIVAAIAYKHGVTQSELAKWLDVERKTIYNWLTRLEEQDLEMAIRDDQRPGRPRKLSAEQREELESVLRDPPNESGIAAPWWTTDLLREFIRDRYGVDYSASSCRRLMKAAGLAPLPPREALETIPERTTEAMDEGDQIGHFWIPAESGRRS